MPLITAWTRLLALLLCLAGPGLATALTPEEATRVGGDLDRVAGGLSSIDQQLAGVKASVAQILQAVPRLPEELEKVRVNLAAGRDSQAMAS